MSKSKQNFMKEMGELWDAYEESQDSPMSRRKCHGIIEQLSKLVRDLMPVEAPSVCLVVKTRKYGNIAAGKSPTPIAAVQLLLNAADSLCDGVSREEEPGRCGHEWN